MSDGAGSERQLLPRLCRLEKGPNGYGFHLHGEKGKVGQFIRLVEPDSPAETSGLRAGDRLVEVNGENVEKESHQQVVSRIRAAVGAVRLLVVDPETDEQLQKLGVQCQEEMIHGLPAAGQEKPEEKSNEEPQEEAPREQAERPDGEEKSQPAERVNLGHSWGGEGEPLGG